MEVPEAVAKQHARMVFEALVRGQPEKAHAAINRAMAIAGEMQSKVTPQTHIAGLVSVRTANSLDSAGICTVLDLTRQTREQLSHVCQVKGKSIDEIERVLHRHGFALRK